MQQQQQFDNFEGAGFCPPKKRIRAEGSLHSHHVPAEVLPVHVTICEGRGNPAGNERVAEASLVDVRPGDDGTAAEQERRLQEQDRIEEQDRIQEIHRQEQHRQNVEAGPLPSSYWLPSPEHSNAPQPSLTPNGSEVRRYKGITASGRKWAARIAHKGRLICIGSFADQKEAAYMYDLFAMALRNPRSKKGNNGFFIDMKDPEIQQRVNEIKHSGWEKLAQSSKAQYYRNPKRKLKNADGKRTSKAKVRCAHRADVRFCGKCDGIYTCEHGKPKSYCPECSQAPTFCHHLTKKHTRRRRRTCLECKVAGTGGSGRCNSHLLAYCNTCKQLTKNEADNCELGGLASATGRRRLQEAREACVNRGEPITAVRFGTGVQVMDTHTVYARKVKIANNKPGQTVEALVRAMVQSPDPLARKRQAIDRALETLHASASTFDEDDVATAVSHGGVVGQDGGDVL